MEFISDIPSVGCSIRFYTINAHNAGRNQKNQSRGEALEAVRLLSLLRRGGSPTLEVREVLWRCTTDTEARVMAKSSW